MSQLDDLKFHEKHDPEGMRLRIAELPDQIDKAAAAFADISVPTHYVQGADTSPVGYLEAIYVEPDFRQSGIARLLVEKTERWAASQGANELGSDTEIENLNSQKFHRALGFTDAGTIVHFVKKIQKR